MEANLEKIKNPLVLIALFAGISEAAMAITLIQLSEKIQETFVWFVMVFPLVLVFGFFFILYKKPAVLFSPSDYKEDGMYLTSISNDSRNPALDKRLEQLEESLGVVQNYVEQIGDQNNVPGGFTETWRQMESLHQMESNGLYDFLNDELGLTAKQITEIIINTPEIVQLPVEIHNITDSSWKSERMAGVLKIFPDVYNDFESLKKVIGSGKK